MSDEHDEFFMRQAIQSAQQGLYTTDPNPRVGCVLVNAGEVIARGWHEWAGEPHAEVRALSAAGARTRGATVYVTLEPCNHAGRTGPCTDALIAAGVRRVVAGSLDPNTRVAGGGIQRLQDSGIAVRSGVMEREARALNPGFFSRFERGRPFVRLKLGMSLDARTALPDGRSQWITGDAARLDVQAYRARSSAILTSAATVAADDPRLTVRLSYGERVRQPLRIVLLGRRAHVSVNAKVVSNGPTLFMGAGDAPPGFAGLRFERVAEDGSGRPSLRAVMARLADLEINELWVECGANLASLLLKSACVDELIVYVAPVLLGSDAKPLIALHGLQSISAAPRFEYLDVRRVGEDLRCVLRPIYETADAIH